MADTARDARRTHPSSRELKRLLARTFEQSAYVLEQSARLADTDAERRALNGLPEECATERAIARRARAAAKRARTNAAQYAQPEEHEHDTPAQPA